MDWITCEGVKKRYGTNEVLKGVDLSIRPDRIVGLLGKNGAGKSTLFKLMNDLLTPDEGRILFCGEPIGEKSKARISYLPERTYLDRDMKISGALRFFGEFYADFNADRARQLLRELDLKEEMRIRKMSKGTKEKLQLILTMSRDARLFLLDEPIGGVDPATRDYILRTIIGSYNENASIIISTHLIADVEQVLDEVIFLQNGRIALHSSVDAIRNEKGTSVDALFREVFRC